MNKLPRINVTFNTTNLTTANDAIQEMNKAVCYLDDILFDGAYYSIHKKNDSFSSSAILYLFDSIQAKQNGEESNEILFDLEITKEMQTCFEFVLSYYQQNNPTADFDSIFITVQKDGKYIVNFELDGEEVQPEFEEKEEYSQKEYLQNLYNCLSYNAPEDSVWVYEILKKTEDGIEGSFFYSIHEDIKESQPLIPGEHIYMYHVTEIFLNKFLFEKTENWKKIFFGFHNGRMTYNVLE